MRAWVLSLCWLAAAACEWRDRMHLVKDFKSLTEAPPSRLITQVDLTGDDSFGPGARDTDYMDPGVSHQRTAAVSVFY